MADYQHLPQRTFIKGLNASTDILDLPRGCVPKISNLMLSIRGALRSIFGGSIVASYQGNGIQSTSIAGAIKKIFQGIAVQFNIRSYFILQDCFLALSPALIPSATGTNVMGGTLLPNTTYYYTLALTDNTLYPNSGRAGIAYTFSVTTGPSDNAVIVHYTPLPGPAGYVLTGRTSGLNSLITVIPNSLGPQSPGSGAGPIFSPPIAATYTDNGSITPGAIVTFGANNLLNVVMFELIVAEGGGNYGYDPLSFTSGLLAFPQGPTLKALPPIGGGPVVSSMAFSPCGGVSGLTEATPDMLEFADNIIIVLGNGYIMHLYDLSNVNSPGPVINNFTASYPSWTASVTYLTNDNVIPSTPNGYFYTCIQPGLAGSSPPTWPTTPGDQVVDNQIIWQCVGLVTNSPAPPGAAHAIYYAGSLWVFNTSPTNTSDGLSGPSSLQMSDANNPRSWNPINQAFIGKDDGSEGMGLAQFTIAEVGIPPTGSLVLFKNFSTYQVIGVFGSPNFAIQAVQSDMGCIAPRSIQFLSGYGIVRLSHLGFAIFDGVRDRLISEEIRPYLFSDSPSQTGSLPALDWTFAYLAHGSQIVNPPMYVCAIPIGDSQGKMSRLCCYDLVLRAWIIVDLPTSQVSSNQAILARSIFQIRSPGSQPLTLIGSSQDSTIFRMFYGDGTWTDGVTLVAWSFTTPECFNQQEPGSRIYIRKLRIRGRYTDGHNISGLPINVYLDLNGDDAVGGISAESGLPSYNYSYSSSDNMNGFIVDVDVNETVNNAHAIISGQGNVEIDEVEWLWNAKPGNVPPNLMGS